MIAVTIGIDLGGTRIKGVAIDAEGNVLHQTYTPTNDGEGEVWKEAVAKTVNELKQKLNIEKVSSRYFCARLAK